MALETISHYFLLGLLFPFRAWTAISTYDGSSSSSSRTASSILRGTTARAATLMPPFSTHSQFSDLGEKEKVAARPVEDDETAATTNGEWENNIAIRKKRPGAFFYSRDKGRRTDSSFSSAAATSNSRRPNLSVTAVGSSSSSSYGWRGKNTNATLRKNKNKKFHVDVSVPPAAFPRPSLSSPSSQSTEGGTASASAVFFPTHSMMPECGDDGQNSELQRNRSVITVSG